MARIDIKAVSKLRQRLADAAESYSDAIRKTRTARGAASKSLRIAESNEALDALQAAAIDLVSALATADDGKGYRGRQSDIEAWIRGLLSNAEAHAAGFQLLKKAPFARVFEAAEKAARR